MKLLNKNVHFWMAAIVRNNEIILHLATQPRHRSIQPNYGWLQKKRELSEKVLSDFIKFL
jgi:hypothetical protein